MWVVYYEGSLKTGKWLGPEAEHTVDEQSDDDNGDEGFIGRKKTIRKKSAPDYLKPYPVRLDAVEIQVQAGRKRKKRGKKPKTIKRQRK